MFNKRSLPCPILIGRAPQLELLVQLIRQTQDSKEQIALVTGEAGIGKSRLITETKAIAQQNGFSVLEGHCFESDRAVPYAPLVDLLRSFHATRSGDEISQSLGPNASELVRLLPELAMLMPNTATPIVPMGPEQEKRRIFESLVQYFFRVAELTPLLIIIEDLHWGDENSLDFLLYFVRRIATQPICLFLTVRAEEARPRLNHFLATLDRERHPPEIALMRLDMDQVEVMIREIFELAQPVPADLLKAIYRLTEGNPFFVEEVLKSLSFTNEVSHTDDPWDRRSIEGLHIPLSLQDAVWQRIEPLDLETRDALTMAAVIGQRFDFALLQQMTGTDEQKLIQMLKALIAAQLVTEDSADQFSFRHALTREAVYATLLQHERQKYHRTIAETLERVAARTDNKRVTDLAYHFYKGALWDKALEYSQQAGQQAQALYAPAEAVEYFTQALDSARELEIMPPAILYRERGQADEILGNLEDARTDYKAALESARQVHNAVAEWQSLIDLGFLSAGHDYKVAGRYFMDALALANQLAEPILRAGSLNRLGNWLSNTGRSEEALQAHKEALGIFEDQHNKQGIAETLDLLGTTSGMRGDRAKAAEHLDRAIALFRSLDDTQSLISSLAMRAVQCLPGSCATTFCSLRTRDECVQDASEALRLAHQVDSSAGQAFAENTLAATLLSFGEFGPALSHAQDAHQIATRIEHQQWMVATSCVVGQIYVLLLAPGLAKSSLEAGLSLARELNSAFWIPTLGACLGRMHVLDHNLPAAQAVLQAVMPREQHPQTVAERDVALAWGELMLAQGEPGMALRMGEQLLASVPGLVPGQPTQPIPYLLKLKGEALIALSRPDEAVEALEDARRGAQERNDRPVLWTIHRSLGQAYQVLRREDQARQERTAARQLIEELAATMDEGSLREQFLQKALGSLPKERALRPDEAARRAFEGLTAREREVAAFIAEGKTSREIATQLVISERTVEVHVGNILRKLGFTSRAQIAAWAVQKGLAKH